MSYAISIKRQTTKKLTLAILHLIVLTQYLTVIATVASASAVCIAKVNTSMTNGALIDVLVDIMQLSFLDSLLLFQALNVLVIKGLN